MNETDNLFCNTGDDRYLKLNGKYYRWRLGKGWGHITEDKLPEDIKWNKLADKQRAVFEPELPD